MNIFARPFEALEATQNVAMDGTAKTITFVHPAGDKDGAVNIVVIGTQTVFYSALATPTTSNAKPLLAGTDSTLSLMPGQTTCKLIGTAGSTAYVTRGRGA